MATRQLDAYLNATGGLAHVAAHAGRLIKLQRVFQEIAPPFLANACRVANCKPGKVIIHADSGAVAARLRQMLPSLAGEFLEKGCEVTEIEVKVQPGHAALQHSPPRPARNVGARAKSDLAALAAALPADSLLRASVERLMQESD